MKFLLGTENEALTEVIEIESEIKGLNNINLYHDISNMAEFLLGTSIAFTSGGRTVYELASLRIPAIILFQNERESTHNFAKNFNQHNRNAVAYQRWLNKQSIHR